MLHVPGKRRLLQFLLLQAILFATGLALAHVHDIRNQGSWFGHNLAKKNTYLVKISASPALSKNSWKIPVNVLYTFDSAGKMQPAAGAALLYCHTASMPMLLQKGDTLFVPGNWEPISNAGNPFEFDYAAHCRRAGLYYQQSCSIKNIRLYGAASPEAATFIEKCHNWCMDQLETNFTDQKTLGLIKAMLLGDETNLDPEIRQAYTDTGIVHIIAISGGNVIIFFLAISLLFFWMRQHHLRWVKYLLAIPLVWCYVLMAGAPPSAVRAAIMFTIVAVGIFFQKAPNNLNTLFATAFLLLCAEPMWLFSLGFQLSFIAVLSLVLFYSPIYSLLHTKYKIQKWIWGAVAASLAAEILVAPLIIYYFHTFPVMFLAANLLAALFMALVLYLSIAVVVLFCCPLLASWSAMAVEWINKYFQIAIASMQGFSPPSFHHLVLDGLQLLLVYAGVAGVGSYLLKRWKAGLYLSLVSCCILGATFCYQEWIRLHQRRLVVYHVGSTCHTELILGARHHVIFTDTAAKKATEYAVAPARTMWRAWQPGNALPPHHLLIGGKEVIILNNPPDTNKVPVRQQPNLPCLLVVTYSGNKDLELLKKLYLPSEIVIGSSSFGERELLLTQAKTANIPIHIVALHGAYVAE